MQLERVIVGTDFTQTSVAAAHWVARYLADAAEVVLCHAIDLPRAPAFLRSLLPTPEVVYRNAQYGAEQRLMELAATLGIPRVRTELRFGRPADTLLELARQDGADLIVVGDHGPRHLVHTVLGNTTERLVRSAGVPVLVARGFADVPPASILAPLDDSPVSDEVLAWSRRLQRHFGARVTACYAIDVMQAYGRIRTVSAAARIGELERELRDRAAEWIRQRLTAAGFGDDDAAIEVMVGDPRSVIPVLAGRADAALIVIGSRGAHAVGRAVLGSVADAVLSTTAYPVLVVPARA